MNNEKFGLGFVIGVGIGAIVGAAIGILAAPKSGEETREDIQEYCGVVKDKAIAYATLAQEKGEAVLEKGKEYVAKLKASNENDATEELTVVEE